MKLLALMGLCLILNSCNNGDTLNRGYVISKSQLEPELEEELEEEFAESDFNLDLIQD